MGTRNLICVVKGGKPVIAQYGQWDGYPGGQGVGVLKFARSQEYLKALEAALPRVRFFEAEGRDKAFIEAYNAAAPEWSNQQDNRTPEQIEWFERYISRDIGSKILPAVAMSEDSEVLLKDNFAFGYDGLFCEWVYVIDLDRRTLDVYKGFNKTTVTDGLWLSADSPDTSEYHPVRRVESFELGNLPSADDFVELIGIAVGDE